MNTLSNLSIKDIWWTEQKIWFSRKTLYVQGNFWCEE